MNASPGEREPIVAATQTTAAIQGLDPETQYLLNVPSAAGLQLGIPSDPLTATTHAGSALKPQVTPGDASSLIVTFKTNRSTESVVANTVGAITAYYDRRGTAKSKRLANARAVNISSYLRTLGVSQGMTVTIKSGNTAALQRSAMTRLSTAAAIPANNEQISSLIVRYKAGVSPTVNGAVRGANVVTGGLGTGMTLGRNLGLRMYRVDFARPVSLIDAQRAAAQLSRAPGVKFAEVDRLVTGSATAN